MTSILVVGSGKQAYREYVLQSIASRYSLYLLTDHEPTWQRRHLAGHLVADLTDVAATIESVRGLHAAHGFAGIVTYDEMLVELTAQLADALGLRSSGVSAARSCRDKHAMRMAFEQHGVPSAKCRAVADLAEASAAAAAIGFPVVLKPRALAASIGVIKAASPDELEDAYSIAASASYPGVPVAATVLVEEYLDGPEVSVESIVVDGRVHSIAITRKQVGFEPYFEEVGHVVSAGEPVDDEAGIRDVVVRAHQALGLRFGATHAELRLTPAGPKMVEIAGRLGGDLIPFLAALATGVDLGLAAADVACGLVPELAPSRQQAAAIQFLYPRADCRFVAVDSGPTPATWAEWLVRLEITARAGEELRLPPRGFGSRLGYAVVSGPSAEACRERLALVARHLAIRTEALRARRGA